jgi:hypothetical protein
MTQAFGLGCNGFTARVLISVSGFLSTDGMRRSTACPRGVGEGSPARGGWIQPHCRRAGRGAWCASRVQCRWQHGTHLRSGRATPGTRHIRSPTKPSPRGGSPGSCLTPAGLLGQDWSKHMPPYMVFYAGVGRYGPPGHSVVEHEQYPYIRLRPDAGGPLFDEPNE